MTTLSIYIVSVKEHIKTKETSTAWHKYLF